MTAKDYVDKVPTDFDNEIEALPEVADRIIWRLLFSFPCLQNKFYQGPWKPDAEGHSFDTDRLYKIIGPWSHGEYLCCMFVLNVWNPSYAKSKGWTFDLMEFMGCADNGNRKALLNWLHDPIWP